MKKNLHLFLFILIFLIVLNPSSNLSATCLALRGNGNWIGAHFGGVAAILEKHGSIESVAGGSSASITAFLLDAMRSHRVYAEVKPDAELPPNSLEAQAPLIMAFTLKMLYGYFSEHSNQVFTRIEIFKNKEIHSLLQFINDIEWQDAQSMVQSLLDLDSKYKIKEWINPELLKILFNQNLSLSDRKNFLLTALQNLQSFEVKDQRTFIQPGFLNFETLVGYIGQFADFLSGKSYTDLSVEWMQNAARCSISTRNLSFSNIKNSMKHEYQECYKISKNILEKFSQQLHAKETETWFETSYSLDQKIGHNIRTFISTSVSIQAISNEKIQNIYEQLIKTSIFEKPDLNFDRDMRFGYFTSKSKNYSADENELETNLMQTFPNDKKSSLFLNLGAASWKTALTTSPAEPGLSTAVAFNVEPSQDFDPGERVYSLGGWSDLAPVQILKASGCANIVYLTREGEEALLAKSATRILGAPEETMVALYDQNTPNIQSSLETAEANAKTYRTKWNSFSPTQILEMSEQAYQSVLETP